MAAVRVLVADETPNILKLFQTALEQGDLAAQGLEFRAVTSGEAVLAEAQSWSPHIVFADVLLPHKNGYDVAQQLAEQHKQAPVVLTYSGFVGLDEAKYQQSGARDCLEKPFDEAALQACVAKHLAPQTKPQTNTTDANTASTNATGASATGANATGANATGASAEAIIIEDASVEDASVEDASVEDASVEAARIDVAEGTSTSPFTDEVFSADDHAEAEESAGEAIWNGHEASLPGTQIKNPLLDEAAISSSADKIVAASQSSATDSIEHNSHFNNKALDLELENEAKNTPAPQANFEPPSQNEAIDLEAPEPITSEPVTVESATPEPTDLESDAFESATSESAALEPTTPEPATPEPTDLESTDLEEQNEDLWGDQLEAPDEDEEKIFQTEAPAAAMSSPEGGAATADQNEPHLVDDDEDEEDEEAADDLAMWVQKDLSPSDLSAEADDNTASGIRKAPVANENTASGLSAGPVGGENTASGIRSRPALDENTGSLATNSFIGDDDELEEASFTKTRLPDLPTLQVVQKATKSPQASQGGQQKSGRGSDARRAAADPPAQRRPGARRSEARDPDAKQPDARRHDSRAARPSDGGLRGATSKSDSSWSEETITQARRGPRLVPSPKSGAQTRSFTRNKGLTASGVDLSSIPDLDKQIEQAVHTQAKKIIEQVVWKVVPELAGRMIEKELNRLLQENEGELPLEKTLEKGS